jgi:hypothetical protein
MFFGKKLCDTVPVKIPEPKCFLFNFSFSYLCVPVVNCFLYCLTGTGTISFYLVVIGTIQRYQLWIRILSGIGTGTQGPWIVTRFLPQYRY